MLAPLSANVRQKINEYLAGNITFDDLDRWVTAATWNAPRNPDLDSLVGEIMLLSAEYSRGHRDEADVRQQLQLLLTTHAA